MSRIIERAISIVKSQSIHIRVNEWKGEKKERRRKKRIKDKLFERNHAGHSDRFAHWIRSFEFLPASVSFALSSSSCFPFSGQASRSRNNHVGACAYDCASLVARAPRQRPQLCLDSFFCS